MAEVAADIIVRRSKKLQHAIEAMPSREPLVLDLLQRYARAMAQAGRLERAAAKADGRNRIALLREARGQVQTAMVALREASEHAHRAARMGTRVGQSLPPWLKSADDAPETKGH